MATLTKNQTRDFKLDEFVEDFPMIASDIVYAGAAVTLDSSGNANPLQTDEEFAGFAMAKADNSAGAAAAITVPVRIRGFIKLSVTGVTAQSDYGDTVYATDDNTFTLTASGGLAVGKFHRWVTGTTCWVYFESLATRSI